MDLGEVSRRLPRNRRFRRLLSAPVGATIIGLMLTAFRRRDDRFAGPPLPGPVPQAATAATEAEPFEQGEE
jgi:hypothetical protein